MAAITGPAIDRNFRFGKAFRSRTWRRINEVVDPEPKPIPAAVTFVTESSASVYSQLHQTTRIQAFGDGNDTKSPDAIKAEKINHIWTGH
ncbi:MAG: hypothetical protein ACON4H_07875 [Rubripirellula sp.]